MDIDPHPTIFPCESIHRRHVDSPDEQHVHHDTPALIDNLEPAGRGQLECADRHDAFHGKPGGIRRCECTNRHNIVERVAGRIGELQRSDGHDNQRWKPGRIGELERSDGHDNQRWKPGRIGELERSDGHDNQRWKPGRIGKFDCPNRDDDQDGKPGCFRRLFRADDHRNLLLDLSGWFRAGTVRPDHPGRTGLDIDFFIDEFDERRFGVRNGRCADVNDDDRLDRLRQRRSGCIFGADIDLNQFQSVSLSEKQSASRSG
jgi:hypothetical protein